MKTLIDFIHNKAFPCIMAKAVSKNGNLVINEEDEITSVKSIESIQNKLYQFVDSYRHSRDKLHSFVLVLNNKSYHSFDHFEKAFWFFLHSLKKLDGLHYIHDTRVSSYPDDDNFSFSIKSEAFFILALHPQSPRKSRRFSKPVIVFNPHQQFEKLRERKIFKKIQSIIRDRDKKLQGSINPMLSDFGERTEVFQYLGKVYNANDHNPLIL